MESTAVFDVIIVGAGPTGLVLANLLGQRGRSVLIVEANDSTVGEPRAVSIDDESLRTVQALGLLGPVMSEIVAGYGSEYRSPNGSAFLTVRPEEQPYGHPRRNAFQQPIFEAQLREGLARYPSVQTTFCTRAVSYQEHAEEVNVSMQFADGISSVERGRYLIGCDGARSTVRQWLGSQLVGDSMDERWLIVDLANSPVATKETIVFCDSRRPCIALPGPRLTRRFEFKVMPGETDQELLSEKSIARLLNEIGAAPESRIIRKTIYRFHALIADRWGRGRVWLAGDAAHLSPPFAGQGLNSGVRDAFNLAWKLDYVLSGKFGLGLLPSYEMERKQHVSQMIRLALRMGTIMGPRSRFQGALIRTVFRLLGLWPAARSYFGEMKYKPPPRFLSGFLLATKALRSDGVGRMLAQPRLRCDAQGAGTLLDEFLGNGFVLLGIDVLEADIRSISFGQRWDQLIERRLAFSATKVPELAKHSGKLLLLRPDRYVMARFELRHGANAMAALNALLKQTWQKL